MIDCEKPATKLWHPIGMDSKLVRVTPKTGESITVRISPTGEVHKFNCDDRSNPCDPPPSIAKLLPRRLLSGFLGSPAESYARIRLMLSRSSKEEGERVTVDHAVAAEGGITSANLIRPQSPAAEYLLELCPFNAENGCPKEHRPTRVPWKPGAAAPWPTPVRPGLYEIVLSSAGPMPLRTKDRGFLLVVAAGGLEQALSRVGAGEQLFLREWKDREEGRLMFRALLLYLAGEASRP